MSRGGAHVLVVDDDDDLRALLEMVLRAEGYEVAGVGDANAAVEAVDAGGVDLVVLDVNLGQGDGRKVLGHIRERGELPVVMISAHGETEDRVLGLRLGADDYLTKPFSPMELTARVATVLRRSRHYPARGAPAPVEAPDGLVVDERTREVRLHERVVELTAREFDLLAFLARSPRQVFTRSQLLEQVWDSRSEWQDEATVTEHVRRVRRKIEPDPDRPRWLVTVRGVGYRYEP